MKQNDSIAEVAKQLGMTLKSDDFSLNKQLLAGKLNELIQHDFHKLISILYRLDISEEKLKRLLKENPGQDAGILIADLIIERQAQKAKSRQQFRQSNDNINEDEKW